MQLGTTGFDILHFFVEIYIILWKFEDAIKISSDSEMSSTFCGDGMME